MKRTLYSLLLALALAAATISIAREYSVFDVIGDSISDGINPDCYAPLWEKYGWVHMLFGLHGTSNSPPELTLTNLWPAITRYNSAISGSTAGQWADTNSYAYLTNVLSHHPDVVAVMIGGNDFLAYISDGVVTPAESAEYQTNLTIIIETLQTLDPAPEIMLLGYYDLFDGCSTNPSVPLNYRALSQVAPVANEMIRAIAASHGCFYVDIYDDFLHHGYGAELGDTHHLAPDYFWTPLTHIDIHPVTAGHLKIYERVYSQLEEFKDIPRFVEWRMESNRVVLVWTSGIDQEYVVERSTNLTQTGGFSPYCTNWSTPPLNTHTDALDNADRLFYRIRVGK